jgi:hypothetical protein
MGGIIPEAGRTERREKRKESRGRDQAIGDMGVRIELGFGEILRPAQGGSWMDQQACEIIEIWIMARNDPGMRPG